MANSNGLCALETIIAIELDVFLGQKEQDCVKPENEEWESVTPRHKSKPKLKPWDAEKLRAFERFYWFYSIHLQIYFFQIVQKTNVAFKFFLTKFEIHTFKLQ